MACKLLKAILEGEEWKANFTGLDLNELTPLRFNWINYVLDKPFAQWDGTSG